MVQADICKYIILSDTDRKKGDLQYPHPNVVHRLPSCYLVEFDTSRMIKNCFATKRRGGSLPTLLECRRDRTRQNGAS